MWYFPFFLGGVAENRHAHDVLGWGHYAMVVHTTTGKDGRSVDKQEAIGLTRKMRQQTDPRVNTPEGEPAVAPTLYQSPENKRIIDGLVLLREGQSVVRSALPKEVV